MEAYTLKLEFYADGEDTPSDVEVITVEAADSEDARTLAPVFMKTRAMGRLIRFFDDNGTELFGNH